MAAARELDLPVVVLLAPADRDAFALSAARTIRLGETRAEGGERLAAQDWPEVHVEVIACDLVRARTGLLRRGDGPLDVAAGSVGQHQQQRVALLFLHG